MKALLVATISHDVDHRGFNNAFLVKCGDPLSRLYGSSTMESHHYEQTIYLLQVRILQTFKFSVVAFFNSDLLNILNYILSEKSLRWWTKLGGENCKYVSARRMQYLWWPIVRRIQGGFELYTAWYTSNGSRFVFPLPENGQEALSFKLIGFYQQRSFVSITIGFDLAMFFTRVGFLFGFIHSRNANNQSQRPEYQISTLDRK